MATWKDLKGELWGTSVLSSRKDEGKRAELTEKEWSKRQQENQDSIVWEAE